MHLFGQNIKKSNLKDWAEHVKFYTGGWFFASIFFYIMRQVGVSGLAHQNFTAIHFILLLPLFAMFSGIIFGSLQYFFQKYLFRKIPL
jgi:hypothetical protein